MKSIILLISSIILTSCGGVIGNIQKYDYYKSSPEMIEEAIRVVYLKYPECIPKDSSKYGIGANNSYYFVVNEEKDLFLFECKIIPPVGSIGSELSLTSATKWGEVMKLASHLSWSEKRKFKSIFEKNILMNIEKEIRNK